MTWILVIALGAWCWFWWWIGGFLFRKVGRD